MAYHISLRGLGQPDSPWTPTDPVVSPRRPVPMKGCVSGSQAHHYSGGTRTNPIRETVCCPKGYTLKYARCASAAFRELPKTARDAWLKKVVPYKPSQVGMRPGLAVPKTLPTLSPKPRIVNGIVTCPEGWYARTPNNALASCLPHTVTSSPLLPCPVGTKKVCKEVPEGVRCDCESVDVVPVIGPGGEPMAEEVVAVKEKRKVPRWAWFALLGGGGLVVGGALVGIGVALARKGGG